MEIKIGTDQYLYVHRLLGRLWTNEEAFPLTFPYMWIPSSLHSHLKF